MNRPQPPTLLVLDYPGYRAEARFAELPLPAERVVVRHLLDGALPRHTRGDAYARGLLDGTWPEVAAVAAYCASAPLAFAVAAQVRGTEPGLPPRLLLLDAEPDTRTPLVTSHRQALGQFGAPGGRLPEAELLASLDDDPEGVVDTLVSQVREHAVAALRGVSEDEREAVSGAEQMAATYDTWTRHLVAAHHTHVADWPGDVQHIRSADSEGEVFAHGARTVRHTWIDVARKDLLRCERTGAAVLAALAG